MNIQTFKSTHKRSINAKKNATLQNVEHIEEARPIQFFILK